MTGSPIRYPAPGQSAGPGASPLCQRCRRYQPPMPGIVRFCVFCSAPLPVVRWRAMTPPGLSVPKRRPPKSDRYAATYSKGLDGQYEGPPSYGSGVPRWGFPPVVWRSGTVFTSVDDSVVKGGTAAVSRVLRVGGYLAVVTGVAAGVLTGAEIWRYALMLRGRTQVLSGSVVRSSDRLVTVAALTSAVAALLTVATVLPALVTAHGAVARRAGLTPSRPPAGVLARLIVPFWNLYGAGQIMAEIFAAPEPDDPVGGAPRRRVPRMVSWWWLAWIGNGILVLVTLSRAFGGSLQAVADTVELHVAVDATAFLVGLLGALVLFRIRRKLAGPMRAIPAGWIVAPPPPTRAIAPAAVPVEAVPAVPVEAVPAVPVEAVPAVPVEAVPAVPVEAVPAAEVQTVAVEPEERAPVVPDESDPGRGAD